jgi:hypothetical protein
MGLRTLLAARREGGDEVAGFGLEVGGPLAITTPRNCSWGPEIFTVVNPYVKYFLGPDNTPGGRNRAPGRPVPLGARAPPPQRARGGARPLPSGPARGLHAPVMLLAVDRICVGLLCGRAGRSTAQNDGFWPRRASMTLISSAVLVG